MGAYKKNLILSLGLISASVDLEAVAPRATSSLSRICSEHSIKLKQKYECLGTETAERHDVDWGSWNMGMETAEGYKVVDQETRPRVEGVSGLSLVPVPRKDLESSTFMGDAVYYASPSNEHVEQTWQVLNAIIRKGKVALIAKGALRAGTNTEKIWRLDTFNGYLVLREVRFPENIKRSPQLPKGKVDRDLVKMAEQFTDGLTTEWNDFDSSDSMSARMSEWMENGMDVVSQSVSAEPALDLKAALAAALDG